MIAAASIATPTALAETYYVSSKYGSDADPGTTDSPFKTIQRAASMVEPGDTVEVRPRYIHRHGWRRHHRANHAWRLPREVGYFSQ